MTFVYFHINFIHNPYLRIYFHSMIMKEIKMLDLTGQYERIRNEVDEAIADVVKAGNFIRGKQIKIFQEALSEYMHVPYVIPCGNGTDALQVALMSLDLQPGDEVITVPFTFISTIEVIRLLGFKVVLCDVDPDTFNIDIVKLKDLISDKTKVILPVHLFGQCVDMDSINELAEKHGLFIIEDAAQALGTNYIYRNGEKKKAGTIGTIGCTSFFPSKNLGAWGDGGAIFTGNSTYGKKMQAIVNHGMEKKYYYEYVGVNSRLDTLQAAILNVKLKYLDDNIKAKVKIADLYDEKLKAIPGIQLPKRINWSDHSFHQYTIKVFDNRRDILKNYLQERNIPSMVYYPLPAHLQKAYADLGYRKGDFPVSEELCSQVLSLPIYPELEEEQLCYICETVKECICS